MKNLFKSLVVGALLLGSVGCSDMFKEDLYEINNEIDKINQRIDSLCNAVNTNIASLQTIIDVMQDNDYVDSITPIVENGVTIGYEIVFTQSGSVKIYHGEKGETGATGHSPVVGVKQAEDGRWYWTIDGEWMVNAEGKKILAEAIDGEDGAPGADGIPGIDGITPKLKVQDNYWYISYDNGTTWERLGKATGEAGTDGDSMFQSVNYNEDYVELVLVDGTVLTIPTWASHMLLVDEIAKINNNISALQTAVKALESNDYVQKVTPVKDEEGNVVGYTLQFAFAGDVTIYHGEDGEKGEDGHTPVIGVKQFNGEWYWTIDGEWLVDGNGEMVPTSGEDGAEGAEGQAGITPELKIEDDYWYVSYDKGQTWTKLGKAKGEDGAAGGDGAAGDAFFEGVDVSDEYYVKFTLADGTEIKIPTWKAHQELADAVAHLNTNVQSMQTIITAIQNNDFVTGTTEIVDPQTNEVIGYKLHFSKSGDIEIYHGKTPNAPEIGIKKHPQYGLCWTYDGEYIKDPSTGKPVALPQDGADAVAPKFKIEDGRWWMSTDGGRSWEDIGQATGDQGATGETGGSGDSFFKSVTEETVKDENGRDVVAYIVMTLADGSEYRVPTAYITDELTKRIAAIEAQFSTISTIVNALQNAEYIKDVVELYEGPALVGYEITFVKYTIGADGKLTETTRKSTIRNGGAGAAGTVVAAQYDEATDTWYWTLDGQPLVDKDGNYVAINGRPGQSGVTPKMQINKDTNEWEVSYDNGKTWESTGVKATGPQGPQGNPGQGGAAGDSFFAGVSKDGDYWIFELVSGEKIMVPTAEAFASLAERVAALEKSAESILSLVNGKKYIESCEPFSNDSGSGYHLVLVSLNAETGEATKEDCYIYNGIAGNTPVVGLRQDEATGDWYWTVDGEDLLVDGKPVKANGPQGIDGPVPSFRIDSTNGHLYVNVNGTETDLGRVVGTNGSAGEAGSSSSIIVTPGEDGQLTIDFIGGDGLTSTIVVPSWEAFVALQEAVSALNTNVQTISALVYGHKYVESFKELENGGYEFVVRYYDEAAKEWKTEVHTIDVTTADEIGVKQDTDGNYYWTKGGEWLLDAAGNKVMVDGSAERTLEFKSENDGKLYYKYSDETEWTVLDIAVSESVVDSNVVVKEEDGKVTVTVLDDAGMILYSFSAPSWEAFEALQGRVIALEEQVTDIYDLIDQLTTNYQALSGDVKNMAAKLAKCKFIGEYEYDEERKGHVIYLVDIDGNKLQNAAGEYETIFIADGEDGEDFDASMLSFTEVDGEYFWTYNGEMLVDAAGKPVKAHGADGRTPEFDLIDDELVYRYEGDEEWISLGNVKGSAAAANITVDPSEVPMWIEIEYSYIDEDGKEYVSKIKVPTYHAYEMAMLEIEAIQSNIDLVEEFLNKGKFVADYELEYDENGMIIGCTMTTVEYKLQEDGSYRVFTSETEFMPSQTMHLEVDENEGVWYLVGYKKGEDGKIEEVRRPLSQSAFTFVPKIAVDKGYIYLAKVSVPGTDYTNTDKWECLGAVVELLGGETGSAQGALKSVEEIDGYICFTFSNGDVLKVPSDAKFQEVLDRLDEVEGAVETIQGTITEINGSLASLSEQITALQEVQGNYLTSAEFNAWKDDARFVQSVTKNGDDWTFVVADGNGNPVSDAAFTVSVDHPISVTTKENGDLYWVINGKEYPVESKPKFQVDPVSGNLQFSIDGSDWTTLESASNAVKVVFTNDPYPTEGEWVEVAAADALWAGIYYSEKNIIWMPTYLNFKNIEGRLAKVEGDVVAIQGSIATINGSLASLSEKITALEGVQGNYLTSADFELWKNDARFVQNVTKNGDVWSFVVADGNGKAIEDAGFDITATHHVSTYEKEGVLYWVINGKETEYPVETKPKFQVDASGRLQFSMNGTDWTTLESASNAVKVVFTNDPAPAEGAWVAVDAADALWAGIYYSEDNIIWMPTYKNFSELVADLAALDTRVTALESTVALHETAINSLSTLPTDVNGLIEDVAKLKTYKFIGTPVQTENGWTIPVVNGAGEPVEGETITLTNGADGANGTVVTIVKNDEDGKYYWAIDGVKTEYAVTGNDGKDGKTPIFNINENGVLEYKFEGEENWIELDKVVGEPGTDGATNVVFASGFAEDGAAIIIDDAAEADWVGIIFIEGEDADSHDDDQIIWVPTYKNFQTLQALVTTINTNVQTLSGLINGKRFITNINDKWSGKVNGVQRTGTEITYVEIKDNVAQPEAKMYIYDGLAGADGVTVGVKEDTDGKLYWTITKDGVESFILDKDGQKILARGTDGTPGTPGEPGTPGSTPEFKVENDILYWKYTTEETWTSLGNIKGDPGVPGEPGTPALSGVDDNGTYYTITYSDGKTVNAQKWVDASNVRVEFFNVSLSDLGNATTPVTELSISEEKTIYYRITGSASDATMPTIMATCEGGYVLEFSQPTTTIGLNTGSMTIIPTYAFATGAKNGKVIVFLDYYGTTKMFELILKGTANVDFSQTIQVSGSEETIVEFPVPSSTEPELGFAYNYTDIDPNSTKVLASKIGATSASDPKWIHTSTYSSATKTHSVKIDANSKNSYRAGVVVVYPKANSQVELAHIRIIQEPGELNLANPDNSGTDVPANCYIISSPGRYLIPTYIGNDVSGGTKGGADISKTTFTTDGHSNTLSNLQFIQKNGMNFIRFDVNMNTSEMYDVEDGNTVIIIKDASGTVIWSWHLWFCPDGYPVVESYPNEAGTANGYQLFDRSIGASSQTGIGMYYQWGRKDPMMLNTSNKVENTASGATYANSIQNPSVFYSDWAGTYTSENSNANGWGSAKSVNDPCPPGYKVPSKDVWRTSNPDEEYSSASSYYYNASRPSTDLPQIFYPYSGHIDADGAFQAKTEHYYEDDAEGLVVDFTITAALGGTPKRFRNIKYKFVESILHGALWSSSTNSLTYGFSSINGASSSLGSFFSTIEVVSCEYCTGERVKTGGSWWNPTYEYVWKDNWQTLDEAGFDALGTTEAVVVSNDLKEYMEGKNINTVGYQYEIGTKHAVPCALQVRCVKEKNT